MYAAYQSHQLWGGCDFSKGSWCSAVSCNKSAKAATSMVREPPLDSSKQPLGDLLEVDRGFRPSGRELHNAKIVTDDGVRIQAPAQLLIKGLASIDVSNGQHDNL